jgi:hypothetical protein
LSTRGRPANRRRFFCDDHLDDLTPAAASSPSAGASASATGRAGRANGFGEVSDRGRKTPAFSTGYGAAAFRSWRACPSKRARDRRLVSARRLERDQDGMKSAQALDNTLQTLVVARDDEGLAAWPDADVQSILRHIDSNKHIHLPSLHMRARDAAPATVRDVRMDG